MHEMVSKKEIKKPFIENNYTLYRTKTTTLYTVRKQLHFIRTKKRIFICGNSSSVFGLRTTITVFMLNRVSTKNADNPIFAVRGNWDLMVNRFFPTSNNQNHLQIGIIGIPVL